jgi:hypothetical protein
MSNPVNKQLAVHYSPEVALGICTEIASGKTLSQVCELEGMPSRNSVYKWLSVYPKFYDAYERAKEISAQSLEDEALLMARTLTEQNDFTGTKVQAYNIAMQQLRWSAARRDPNRYGQKMNSTSVVPIQITTTLNLGQDGKPASGAEASIYTVEIAAHVGQAASQPPIADPAADYTIDLEANPTDTDDLAFGLPQSEEQQLHNPPRGRPKGTHKGVVGRRKSAASVEKTARNYAAAEQKRLAAKAAKETKE